MNACGLPTRRPAHNDAKLVDVSKRTCIVRNVKLVAGEIFSIEEKELTACTPAP